MNDIILMRGYRNIEMATCLSLRTSIRVSCGKGGKYPAVLSTLVVEGFTLEGGLEVERSWPRDTDTLDTVNCEVRTSSDVSLGGDAGLRWRAGASYMQQPVIQFYFGFSMECCGDAGMRHRTCPG